MTGDGPVDSTASLRAWRESPDRAAVIEASSSITESAPDERTTTGLEAWFATADAGVVAPPAPWRTWLLTTVGIYPIITVVSAATAPLLSELPAPLRLLLVTPVLTAVMTWVVMPALSRAAARFLYGSRVPRSGDPAGDEGDRLGSLG
jgi:antibiotic biosynthesis monooxygenase (ABM) superfamily enzyme